MSIITAVYFLIVLAVAVLATVAVWSRRETWVRLATVLFFLGMIPALAAGGASVLGLGKPVDLEFFAEDRDYQVLGSKMIIGEGIYLYLDTPGQPRAYALPWDQKLADQLQDAINEGGPVGVRGLFDGTPFDDGLPPVFWALPQQKALPPKKEPPPPPIYERDA